jgi:hypothetical protein
MKFPGSKLLHQWDLSLRPLSVDDLLGSCRQIGLTGFAEVKLPSAVGLIFYYLGGEINVLFREGTRAVNGQEALERLREKVGEGEGAVSVHELPLDLAHLLRGAANRQRLRETLKSRSDLGDVLLGLEKSEHTGTLEIQTAAGSAMVLLVRGRVSNAYWEAKDGLTFEKGEARRRLEEALRPEEEPLAYLSDFSREVWKSRHEVQVPSRSRLETREEPGFQPTAQVATEEMQLREAVLDGLLAQLPSVLLAMSFDLMTGAVFLRKGRGVSDHNLSPLAERVPHILREIRQTLAAVDADAPLETVEVAMSRLTVLVGVVPDAEEALALLADRAQPGTVLAGALARAIQDFAARLPGVRRNTSRDAQAVAANRP